MMNYIHSPQKTHKSLKRVGSMKLQVSLAEYHLFYRALLQKRPIILQSLLIVATPYLTPYTQVSFAGKPFFERSLLPDLSFYRPHSQEPPKSPIEISYILTYGLAYVSRIDQIIGLFCKKDF